MKALVSTVLGIQNEALSRRCYMFAILRVAALLIILFNPAVASQRFSGEVIGVTDGDTIKVLHDGAVSKVRLASIDCPEHDQAFGHRAKQFTTAYVFGKIVTVENEGSDRYGRTIGEVMPPDKLIDLNHALVASGMAWVYQKYCQDASFYRLESAAQSHHIGLWADPNVEAPWNFRRQEKELKASAKHQHMVGAITGSLKR